MSIEEIKALLQKAKEDPSVLESQRDEIDELLLGVIKIEKKHLYGVGTTSPTRRQEEIKKYLDDHLMRLGG